MTRILVAACALVLAASLFAFTQDTSSQSGSAYPPSNTASQGQTSADQTASTGETSGKAKLRQIKGTIGQDGKTFTADKDNKSWTVVNPDAVKGHEGHHVILSAHVYPDKDQVHVMSVKMAGEAATSNDEKKSSQPMSEQPPQ